MHNFLLLSICGARPDTILLEWYVRDYGLGWYIEKSHITLTHAQSLFAHAHLRARVRDAVRFSPITARILSLIQEII